MAKELISDELWKLFEPLLPPPKPRRRRFPGRKPIEPRRALTGILFVLKSGIPWEMLPQEMGCGSGMTCWRRLHEWQEAGVWKRLHELLLAKLNGADAIDWSRGIVDSGSVRAVHGGKKRARIPPIDERQAASIISSRMGKAFLCRRSSPLRTNPM